MRRVSLALICAGAVLGAVSPSAFAANQVGRTGPDLNAPDIVYAGSVSGGDDLHVTVVAGDLRFSDATKTLDAGPGCSNVDIHVVECSQQNLEELRIHLFNGDNVLDIADQVTVRTLADSGTGDDELAGGNGTERIEGGAGADVIHGGDNPGGPDQVLEGGTGNDEILGGDGRDSLHGGDGTDVLQPGGHKDDIFGGAGVDKVTYFATGAGVNVTLDSVADDGAPGELDNVSEDVENIKGTTHVDHLVGSAKANVIEGSSSADVIEGGDGVDFIDGGAGADEIPPATAPT